MPKILFCVVILLMICMTEVLPKPNSSHDYWFFGQSAGLYFGSDDRNPVPIKSGKLLSVEGCASISDTSGNLVFYTNGSVIFDRNHDTMPNGTGLYGSPWASQSSIIIKHADSDNIYYLFTCDAAPYSGDGIYESTFTHCYSVIDISLNDALGEVIEKNTLIQNNTVEKLTATLHANQRDYWIIARGMNDNTFIVSKLTASGIESIQTFTVGPGTKPVPSSPKHTVGQLKASPSGDLLATIEFGSNNVDIYRFDNNSGTISDYISVLVDSDKDVALYGVEFSPNGRYLYISNIYGKLYQFDVAAYDSTEIVKSRRIVYDSLDLKFAVFGQLQTAPDGKIYVAVPDNTYLSVIHKPNVQSPYCRFEKIGQSLDGSVSKFGLNNGVLKDIIQSVDIYGNDICAGQDDEIKLSAIVHPQADYDYEWSGPNGFYSELQNPSINDADFSNAGLYSCSTYLNGDFFASDSVMINVYDIPEAEIIGLHEICPPETITLSSKYISPEYNYHWSNGSTSSEIDVDGPGTYYLTISNPAACISDTAFFEVNITESLEVTFGDIPEICNDEFVQLFLDTNLYKPLEQYKFHWSTGDTGISIEVNKSGFYKLSVTNIWGCSGTDSVYIPHTEIPSLEFDIGDTVNLCQGEEVFVTLNEIDNKWDYYWSDGLNGVSRIIDKPGTYTIYTVNKNLCSDSNSLTVIINDRPKAEINSNDKYFICDGETLLLESRFKDDDFLYRWSDGSTGSSTEIDKPGIYTLVLTNSKGCTDSTHIEIERIYNLVDIDKENIRIDSICSGEIIDESINILYTTNAEEIVSSCDFVGDKLNIDLYHEVIKISDNKYRQQLRFTVGHNKPGIYRGNIIVSLDKPCGEQIVIPVFVKVVMGFSISAPEIVTDAGSYICLAFEMEAICISPNEYLYSPEFDVEVAADFFYPDSIKGGIILKSEYQDSSRLIRVKSDASSFPTNTKRYLELCGHALIGHKSASVIKIRNSDWGYPQISTVIRNGFLDIDGCVQELRAIQSFKPAEFSISPNPADNFVEITIESQEKGIHTIEIYTMEGKLNDSFKLDNFSENSLQYIGFDTNKYGQGLYRIVLKTPWNIKYGQMMIMRN